MYIKKYIYLVILFFIVCLFLYVNYNELKNNDENIILLEESIKNETVSFNIENNKSEISKEEKQLTKNIYNGNINIYSTNPWRIKIPKLNLDAPIAEGTSSDALARTVGHFENTNKWIGNVALAAHNRGYRCNFFSEIKNLEKGDEIIYLTEKGKRNYKVVINKVIKETDWSYIENTLDNRITLITCENNKKEYRRCIQAIEI